MPTLLWGGGIPTAKRPALGPRLGPWVLRKSFGCLKNPFGILKKSLMRFSRPLDLRSASFSTSFELYSSRFPACLVFAGFDMGPRHEALCDSILEKSVLGFSESFEFDFVSFFKTRAGLFCVFGGSQCTRKRLATGGGVLRVI